MIIAPTGQPEDDPGPVLEEDPDALLLRERSVHRVLVLKVVSLGHGVLLCGAPLALASVLLADAVLNIRKIFFS